MDIEQARQKVISAGFAIPEGGESENARGFLDQYHAGKLSFDLSVYKALSLLTTVVNKKFDPKRAERAGAKKKKRRKKN